MSKWSKDLARVRNRTESADRLLNEEPKNEQDRAWQERVRQNLRDSALIDAELQDAGVPFTLAELPGVSANYSEAFPVLRRYLRETPGENDNLRLAILHALSVPYATNAEFGAVEDLLQHRGSNASDDMLFSIGSCLAAMARKAESDRLLAIVSDAANGSARHQPLLRLARWKDRRVEPYVIQMLGAERSRWSAIRAARYLRLRSVEDAVKGYLTNPNAAVRAEARSFIEAMLGQK